MRNNLKNNRFIGLIVGLLLGVAPMMKADATEEGDVNVQKIVFSHIQDAYTWHITEWNGKEVAIPLPIIVKGDEGWKVFMSNRLHHGENYEGFYIAQEGDHVSNVDTQNIAGEEIRTLDISRTKNVCGLFLSCALLLIIILRTARWYGKHPNEVPKGFTGIVEVVVTYIEDDVIKNSIGKEYYKPYSSFLQTVFFFILINNLIGIIPIFPGGANVTGNIAITFVLAVCTFIAVNLFAATKGYWKDIFWPNVPIYLKLPLPIMPFVEFFGVFTKPFALMIRLFANIMAGHTIILALTCLIFITVSMGVAVNMGMTLVSIVFCVFMNCLELFVACLQAYIFTLLSANYIGLAKVKD